MSAITRIVRMRTSAYVRAVIVVLHRLVILVKDLIQVACRQISPTPVSYHAIAAAVNQAMG